MFKVDLQQREQEGSFQYLWLARRYKDYFEEEKYQLDVHIADLYGTDS